MGADGEFGNDARGFAHLLPVDIDVGHSGFAGDVRLAVDGTGSVEGDGLRTGIGVNGHGALGVAVARFLRL